MPCRGRTRGWRRGCSFWAPPGTWTLLLGAASTVDAPARRKSAHLNFSASYAKPPHPMGDPHLLSSATTSSARKHPGPIDERFSDPSPSVTKRPRVAAEPSAPSDAAPHPEAEVRSLVMMAGGIYPLARAEGLRGLAAVLEKVDVTIQTKFN